jgi:hypothetical protein
MELVANGSVPLVNCLSWTWETRLSPLYLSLGMPVNVSFRVTSFARTLILILPYNHFTRVERRKAKCEAKFLGIYIFIEITFRLLLSHAFDKQMLRCCEAKEKY